VRIILMKLSSVANFQYVSFVDISLVDACSLFSRDLVGQGVARSIASTGIQGEMVPKE
jgi:hypothetical protein